ncbi:MAG: aspartate aminotransferase family protein [Clostridiales bacterium]|nr:aspartate aminotransferase family protein [Clostridiales bacterium]
MNLEQIKKIDKDHFMGVYSSRLPVCFVDGEGCYLYDTNGKKYLDVFAGIAVNTLGYNHPKLTKAICDKASSVMHTSNYFYVKEQAMLEELLCSLSFADKVFFANSGSEANEGAVKLARKFFKNKGENKYKVITLDNSFHGRTLAMVAATGQKKYQKAYTPLTAGFLNVPADDIDLLEKSIDDETCAVMIELIQGEGGIVPMSKSYVKAVRKLCNDKNILLIIDEIQTGIGRTGTMFGYESYGITPDIITLAKGLGGGVPIGAILATDYASAFKPGDHGTTFGGNALACSAAYTVVSTILDENLLQNVVDTGAYLEKQLSSLQEKHDCISDVRGLGLMLAIALKDSSKLSYVVEKMLEEGFVIGTAGGVVLRFVPPLIFSTTQVDDLISTLDMILEEIK